MYIRKFSINGVKGINDQIDISFIPTKDELYSDNVENFGLKKNIEKFSALKQICFIGVNASGKTSILWAIEVSIKMLIMQGNTASFLSSIKNKFANEPLRVKIEIVDNPEADKNSDIKAIKYKIEYEFHKGFFTKETLFYSYATSEEYFDYIPIYEYINKELFINGSKTDANHNSFISIFNLLRTGQANDSYFKEIKLKHAIFRKLFVHSEGLYNFDDFHPNLLGQPIKINTISIPKLASHKKIFLDILQLFDNKIVDFKVDSVTGAPIFEVKSGDKTKDIEGGQFDNYFSSATLIFIKSFGVILNSLFSKNIVLYDEIGRDIHYALYRTYFEIFRKAKSQLFFTTHNDNIFKQNIRKDQIYNVSNKNGHLKFKRLSDVKRFDKNNFNQQEITMELKNTPEPEKIFKLLNNIDKLVDNNE